MNKGKEYHLTFEEEKLSIDSLGVIWIVIKEEELLDSEPVISLEDFAFLPISKR